jgi:hypothetical protein
LTRIYLLLLGDKPSSFVAKQVLDLIAISLNKSKSFSRKFELVSGWTVLKTVLPDVWDANIHAVAFSILLGHAGDQGPVVACSHIFPAILSSLTKMLVAAVHELPSQDVEINETGESSDPHLMLLEILFKLPHFLEGRSVACAEAIVEEIVRLQSSCPTFLQLFESQQTTQTFIHAFQSFVARLSSTNEVSHYHVRICEKLMHFGLTLALDNAAAGPQKREVCLLPLSQLSS